MSYTAPTIAQFKTQFIRDFNFGTDINNNVIDGDIVLAFNRCFYAINPTLFSDELSYQIAYNLLSAHYMVLNLRSSSQGLNGQYNWAQNTKAAGPVSEGFQIPDRITENPELMMLTKTNYGAAYLEMVLPLLTGACFAVYGRTKP